ncbi:MAG: hypothetical protein ACRDYC_13635 [Acidimicrobiales bacterium]
MTITPGGTGSAGGQLVCSYDNSSSVNVVLSFSSASGLSATTLKTVVTQDAQGVAITSVSGYGSAAYLYTANDAAGNPNGVPTANMSILAGADLVLVSGAVTTAQVEAIAKAVI